RALERVQRLLRSKNSLAFFVMFSIPTFLFVVAVQSRIAATEATGPLDPYLPEAFVEPSAVAVDMPRLGAVLLIFVAFYMGSYVAMVVTRTFYHGYDWGDVPREVYTEDVVVSSLNFTLASLTFIPLFFIALALFILPGAFIAISFAFYAVYISIGGEGYIDSFMKSWGFSRGRRLPLLMLFGAFLLGMIFIGAVGLVLYVVVWNVSTVVAELMLAFGLAALLVFTLAVVTSTFVTLGPEGVDVEPES
ncbi:MAG: hypothetical protein ACLFMT_07235, partial [Halobacteriales archaeon]